jgi:RNA polymerase sigma-70 factor (ECF subfamily)
LPDVPKSAFVRLMDVHGPALRAMLHNLCRRPQDMDDVWQDTAVRVWKSLQKHPWLKNPRGWLATIAYRAFVDHTAQRPLMTPPVDFDQADEFTPTPHETAVLTEQRLLVWKALDALPEDLRSVVVLHYTAGLSLRETAEALGVAVGTAKSRLHAALTALRRMLQ